jgi:hypothetical protein
LEPGSSFWFDGYMKKILIQLDTDAQPSSFDRVVAVDSDVDELFSYGNVTPDSVEGLVHGAMFTRGPKDLKNTAIFIGGSNVSAGEALLEKVRSVFFGPMSVSVLMDSNGSNTTAAAAVLCALKHLEAGTTTATVLGGTGPVGQRAAQLLSKLGATVRLVSRSHERAIVACDAIGGGNLEPIGADDESAIKEACVGSNLVLAAGAAGVQFLSEATRKAIDAKVLIDVNAVPPVGIEGIGVMDSAAELDDAVVYGAIGVGGLKMKIHKAAVRKLFTANNLILDTDAIFELGRELV